ncbi:MAG: insulinase family protein [bacterium]|nr:insulinase family protein [bacterium]
MLRLIVFIIAALAFMLPAVVCAWPAWTEKELPSGARVIFIPDSSSRTVSVNIWVKAGSRDEDKGEEGISHFLEHLFFRGSEEESGAEFKAAIEALGGVSNAETANDYTRYYINAPSKNASKALSMLIHALKKASFSKDELEIERKVILEECRMRGNAASSVLFNAAIETAYGQHPYARPVIGYEANIKRFSRNDFLSYREKMYRPSNLVFVIAGRFSEKEALGIISDEYGSLSGYAERYDRKEFAIPSGKPKEKRLKSSGISEVMAGYYAPPASKERELCAADVFCFLIGKGRSSVLAKARENSGGRILSMGVDFQTMKDPGLILFSASSNDMTPEELKSEIDAAVRYVADGKFSDADLARARRILSAESVYSFDTNAGRAGSFGLYAVIGRSGFAADYAGMIEKVSRDDVIGIASGFSGGPDVFVFSGGPKKK